MAPKPPFRGAVHVAEHWRRPPGPRFTFLHFLLLLLLLLLLFGGGR